MGSAQRQGALWDARAEDWAVAQEPAWNPIFETALAFAGVRSGARLLDVGCGAGGMLVCARARGALVSGLDASASLVAIARRRLPDARIEVGEMEDLPESVASAREMAPRGGRLHTRVDSTKQNRQPGLDNVGQRQSRIDVRRGWTRCLQSASPPLADSSGRYARRPRRAALAMRPHPL